MPPFPARSSASTRDLGTNLAKQEPVAGRFARVTTPRSECMPTTTLAAPSQTHSRDRDAPSWDRNVDLYIRSGPSRVGREPPPFGHALKRAQAFGSSRSPSRPRSLAPSAARGGRPAVTAPSIPSRRALHKPTERGERAYKNGLQTARLV
jgi:hypothetical protein